MLPRLIIATGNKDKFKEIKNILQDLDINITYLKRLKRKVIIREEGKTFFANAKLKAEAVSFLYPEDFVVGEDSGLEVEFLNNKPGIFSRRYAGENSTYLKNNLKLLKELKNVEGKERKARFISCIVLAKNKKLLKMFKGKLCGFIHTKIEGRSGFGYDPIFYLPRYKTTVANLSGEEKNRISHRAKAFNKLKNFLIRKGYVQEKKKR